MDAFRRILSHHITSCNANRVTNKTLQPSLIKKENFTKLPWWYRLFWHGYLRITFTDELNNKHSLLKIIDQIYATDTKCFVMLQPQYIFSLCHLNHKCIRIWRWFLPSPTINNELLIFFPSVDAAVLFKLLILDIS